MSGNGGRWLSALLPSFRPGRSPLAPDFTEEESRLPVGRQLAGPFPSYHKVPPRSVATSHKAIHYLAVPLEEGGGVGRGERKATQIINCSREKGRGFVARQLFCSSTSTSRVGEGCGLQRNHESPDGRREAMRPRWAHGWKRRQTRVMQLSMGGGGLGDAPVFAPAEMRNAMKGREKSSHDFALAQTEQPVMSPARRVVPAGNGKWGPCFTRLCLSFIGFGLGNVSIPSHLQH